MSRCVGLDVHKSVTQSAIISQSGQKLGSDRFGCSRAELELYARTKLQPTDRVALEATTNTWAIVDVLRPFVAEVVVSNPMRTKAIASAKVKTDKVDALVLAELLRCDYLPLVWQPPPEVQADRAITSRRAALVADRTAVMNRVHAVLRQRLIDEPKRLFATKGRAWLAKLDLDPEGRRAIDSDLRILDVYDTEIDAIDTLLLQRSADNSNVQILVTLPGIDVSVAQTLNAVIGDVTRFATADQAASYIGIVPSTRQSADHCYHGPITKQGNSRARWLLTQAAQNVGAHPGPLGAFFRRIAKKRGRSIAVVATARKLVVVAWHMLTNREPYRYALPNTVEPKLRKIRTATGARRRAKPGTISTRPNPETPGTILRRVKSLKEVYQSEGLPPTQAPAQGEIRMLAEQLLEDTVANAVAEKWLPKPERKSTAKKKETVSKRTRHRT